MTSMTSRKISSGVALGRLSRSSTRYRQLSSLARSWSASMILSMEWCGWVMSVVPPGSGAHDAVPSAPVHLDQEGDVEPDVPHEVGFRHGPLPRQPGPIEPVVPIVADAEVAHLEARHVMEEMRALAQIHVHGRKGRLDDGLRPADLPPDDRDAQRRVGAAPT